MRERDSERERERGIAREKEGERKIKYLFLKGMITALALFSYLVKKRD